MITRDHPMFTTFALLESFPITVRGTSVHWREAVETCYGVATRSLVGASESEGAEAECVRGHQTDEISRRNRSPTAGRAAS
jgi:hypothetical protein